MSYLVLARKWRPRQFDEMVGQSHVLQALSNALDRGRLHHAYLFTGTRGVGKTTVARIFAKALNCERGVSSQPCGECGACQEIDAGRFVDLIEVDAASRTKVDDTRELLENVVYLPVKGRFKIYLIDEVHMFSQASFNALLKTLEEPPEHVKFLLATTDPQRLPVTVLSRCLQFNLRALAPAHIQSYLGDILGREEIEAEPEALALLADAAGGSVRDALSLLDQAIGFSDGQLKAEVVADMLGVTDSRLLQGLLDALAAGESQTLFSLVNQALERSVDPSRLLAELAEAIHRAALAQWLPSDGVTVEAAPQTLQLWYQIALSGRRDIGWAPSPRVGLEMTLLRMLAFQPGPSSNGSPGQGGTDATATGLPERSRRQAPPVIADSPPASYRSKQPRESVEPVSAAPRPTPAANDVVAASTTLADPSAVASGAVTIAPDNWAGIVARVPMPARNLAERCHVTIEDDAVVLVIDPDFRSMASSATRERLTTQLDRLGVTQPVRFRVGDVSDNIPGNISGNAPISASRSAPSHAPGNVSSNGQGNIQGDFQQGQAAPEATMTGMAESAAIPPPSMPPAAAPIETPAEIRERNEQAAAEAREASLREHPAARVLVERAGAELIQESLRPIDANSGQGGPGSSQ